jgi:glutamate-1-semialdehyde aminotransferase
MSGLLKMSKGYKFFEYAKTLIPGGSQLFGKRADLYLPKFWPSYYNTAHGCSVTSIDGVEYMDFTMVGTGTSVLGYANKSVNQAVIEAIDKGNITTLNNTEEVKLAEVLLGLHPGMDMARFARTGGEILGVAVRLARAYKRKSKIAICGYHGWHDWYLASNIGDTNRLNEHLLSGIVPIGVPSELSGTAVPFKYNDVDNLLAALGTNDDFAAVVIEPFRDDGPSPGYLERLRQICNDKGLVLIFDEVTSGFRETLGAMYLRSAVVPDMFTFGKAVSNGFPFSALLGRREVMSSFDDTFVSSTYWGDRIGPTAALSTIDYMKRHSTPEKIRGIGAKIHNIITRSSQLAGVGIKISGPPSLLSYRLLVENWPAALTYLIQEMLKRNILFSDRVYANLAHDDIKLEKFEFCINQVMAALAQRLRDGNLLASLEGPVKQMGLKKV